MTKHQIFIPILLIMISITSCQEQLQQLSIVDENGTNNCLRLKAVITSNDIDEVLLSRPLGYSFDTTLYDLEGIDHLYGERLFTLGNEGFQCKNIDSIVSINNKTLSIKYNIAGYDNSGPFTQEFVSNFWESGNGYLLNKRLPSFNGNTYSRGLVNLDSIIGNSNKTLIHFGWLSCRGCTVEQKEISRLINEKPEIEFVNITIDKEEELDKYLIDKGVYFELKSPYSKLSKTMAKPIFLDENENIFEYFHLKGLFPVNFLVDKSGRVEKIGSLLEIFKTESDSIEIFRVN